jgi:hypothetical protein
MQTIQDFAGSTDMWSISVGGHLMTVVNLTGFTVYIHINKIPHIIHNSHKTILLQTATKLTARYIHNFYKAAQYIQFPQPHLSYSNTISHASFIYVVLYFIILITEYKRDLVLLRSC